MNAIKNIYAVLALIALCLSSCEMKNELEGKYNLKNDEGLLTLDLVNKTQATPTTKAESTSLTDELDVNTYKVVVGVKTKENKRFFIHLLHQSRVCCKIKMRL